MRRMVRVGVSVCLGLCLQLGQTLAADVPEMGEYAYGFPVQTEQAGDYYRLKLPYIVYDSVSDPRLRDLGVYDANGQPVPRVVERPARRPEPKEQRVALRVFPLMREAPSQPDDIRLLLQRDANGTQLELNTTTTAPAGDSMPTQPASYILDLRALDHPLETLELGWQPTDQTFIGRVEVMGSQDLEAWTAVGDGAVANLNDGETRISANRIALRSGQYKYLRIGWSGLPADWSLRHATGYFHQNGDEVELEWLELEPDRDEDGAWVFEMAGSPLVERIELSFPDDNVVIRGSVQAWSETGERWLRLHQGLFYHWRRGGDAVASPSQAVSPLRANRWKVVIDKGRADTPVRLRLGWRPDRLLFVAQGQGPYTVAAGRAADALEGFPQEVAFGDAGILGMLRDTGRGSDARLGDRYPLAGSGKLVAARRIDLATVSLWIALVLGVALVGWMALSLVRQLGQKA